ncbi:hypothetical protein CKAH01_03747 [Colletotrichum kahawae]|uniref:Uncharacterized protein n=1 Tax=Colletotrichum kahawae TaxID=34407 RepID=A0AAD9YQ73_COLKA|nr:hypothetical protein CKAH01_03747 [Colletotrichum kahawae]
MVCGPHQGTWPATTHRHRRGALALQSHHH